MFRNSQASTYKQHFIPSQMRTRKVIEFNTSATESCDLRDTCQTARSELLKCQWYLLLKKMKLVNGIWINLHICPDTLQIEIGFMWHLYPLFSVHFDSLFFSRPFTSAVKLSGSSTTTEQWWQTVCGTPKCFIQGWEYNWGRSCCIRVTWSSTDRASTSSTTRP